MSNTAQATNETLRKAYDEFVGQGLKLVEAGWEHSTATAKLLAKAVEDEQVEAKQASEALVGFARERNEVFAALVKSLFSAGPPEKPSQQDQAKEALEKLFKQDKALYQDWSRRLLAFQERQVSLAKSLVESNLSALDASQKLTESLSQYGESVLESFQEATKAVVSGVPGSFPGFAPAGSDNGKERPSRKAMGV